MTETCANCRWSRGNVNVNGLRCFIPLPPRLAAITEVSLVDTDYWCALWQAKEQPRRRGDDRGPNLLAEAV